MSKMELKEFTKTDWYAYAGAECFADGSEPMIAGYEKDGEWVNLIADKNGVEIEVGYDAGKSGREKVGRIWYVNYSHLIEVAGMNKRLIIAMATGLVSSLNELLDKTEKVFDLKAILEGDDWNFEFDEV